MDAKAKTVFVMAGGTGGHVFPALATAQVLQQQGVHVEWLGTAKGIEADVIPKAGIKLHCINVSGLRGKGKLSLLKAPFKLLQAVWQAYSVFRQVKPDAVLGMGGFASGPGGLVAWLTRTPLVIQEQNAVAGLTNKILSRFASHVAEAFGGAFKGKVSTQVTGNPVRGPILEMDPPEVRMSERTGPLRILVVGGSLGAQAINSLLPEVLAQIPEGDRPEVWHQTGKRHLEATLKGYESHKVSAKVVPFIDQMEQAYGWADLVICRAGALTVSELAIAGVASVLVPYPYAVDDHQSVNADWLTEQGAAVKVLQKDLTQQRLLELLNELNSREKLLDMAKKGRAQAKPDAGEQVASFCQEMMNR